MFYLEWWWSCSRWSRVVWVLRVFCHRCSGAFAIFPIFQARRVLKVLGARKSLSTRATSVPSRLVCIFGPGSMPTGSNKRINCCLRWIGLRRLTFGFSGLRRVDIVPIFFSVRNCWCPLSSYLGSILGFVVFFSIFLSPVESVAFQTPSWNLWGRGLTGELM